MIFIIGLLIGSVLAGWNSQAATLTPDVSFSGVQFATEPSLQSRLDFGFLASGNEGRNEARLLGFMESGAQGQTSIDLDPVVLRFNAISGGHLWIGRTHPAQETFRLSVIERTSALGANWTQNQHNALEPRVSGWIGAGFRQTIPRTPIFVSMSFSPIFLPSFGPSLNLSKSEDATGSRFTRLPPSQVQLPSGTLLSLRYDLQAGDLRQIVQQPQWFQSIGYEDKLVQASLFGWSGPKPDPVVSPSTQPRIVQEQDFDILVTVKPSFPRQHFWGARLASERIPFSPEAELAWEAHSRQTTVSAAVQPLRGRLAWRLGALNRFGDLEKSYARTLAWTEAASPVFRTLSGSIRYEQHLLNEFEGGWVKPSLQLQATKAMSMFATASIIAGQDGSYFGNWRSLDSVAIGARATW